MYTYSPILNLILHHEEYTLKLVSENRIFFVVYSNCSPKSLPLFPFCLLPPASCLLPSASFSPRLYFFIFSNEFSNYSITNDAIRTFIPTCPDIWHFYFSSYPLSLRAKFILFYCPRRSRLSYSLIQENLLFICLFSTQSHSCSPLPYSLLPCGSL